MTGSLVNSELERIWYIRVMTEFDVLSQHLPAETEPRFELMNPHPPVEYEGKVAYRDIDIVVSDTYVTACHICCTTCVVTCNIPL
jgi:hypothetical protein